MFGFTVDKNLNKTMITVVLVIICVFIASYLEQAIIPFALAAIVSYLFVPFVDYLEKKGIPRSLACAVLTVIIASIIVSFTLIIIPMFLHKMLTALQNAHLTQEEIRNNIHYIIQKTDIGSKQEHLIASMIDNMMYELKAKSTAVITTLISSSAKIVNAIATVFCVPIISYYMMRDWSYLVLGVRNMIPKRYVGSLSIVIDDISLSISSYIRGQFKVCLILMLMYGGMLFFTGINFGFLIGICIGLFSFIPYIGFILGFTTSIFIAYQQFNNATHIAIVAICLLVGQMIESNFVTPRIIGKSVGLSPVWMMFGLIASIAIFGIVGAIFALPLVVISTVIIRAIVKFYKSTSYYNNVK